ncbi:MAG TPA: CYTH domain-containing protein [Dissulfurispiraceae bacterium]|nr:CYTH domain-containing protein [Dissulfurispiraceae bacterium]
MIISEKERKLLIDSHHGRSVVDGIRGRDEIGLFRLGKNIFIDIYDAYFDLDNFPLAKKGSYLRIRGRNDGHFITMRNNVAGKHDDLIVDEVTHPLDDKGLEIAIANITENMGALGTARTNLPHFHEILGSIGIKEVLRVHVERIERDIILDDVRIGKMKMDSLSYVSPQNFGPFFEIEVDSYKEIFHKSAADFFSELQTKYHEIAQISSTSKYIRGINITYGLSI